MMYLSTDYKTDNLLHSWMRKHQTVSATVPSGASQLLGYRANAIVH